MRKAILFFLVGLLVFSALAQAEGVETYFKFRIESRQGLDKLTRIISIDNVKGDTVFAYANEEEFQKFKELGYSYEILPHPGTLITPKMATSKDGMRSWDSYPTYSAYVNMMNQFAINHPTICQIVNVGTTVDGHALLFAKISKNVDIEEDEPEVMYLSSMHGDETTGYVLMLRLIDSLLNSYGTDSLVTRLVDSCEIWINPLENPDGTYAGGDNTVNGATRYNANGKDLNRNYPDPADGQNPDGGPYQPETIAMMNFAASHTFTISANFHGGAEVFNYPWDTWSRLHVDTDWMEKIGRQFADTVHQHAPGGYMDDLNNGVTNGYAWYRVTGGRQDYMTYWQGDREITIEISNTKLLPAGQLPTYWGYLRLSFLDFLENALYGIRGVVTDASTGQPVLALIKVLGHDSASDSSMIYTDPDIGDYHRMLSPGTYNLEFSAPGYYTDTVSSISIALYQTARVDVALQPLPNIPDLAFISHNAGMIDPGDTINMNITLINNGGGVAYNPAGTFSTTDPYITVMQAISAYPNIPALGGTGVSSSQYRFEVSPSCPLLHSVSFRLDLTANGGYVDSTFFTIMVGQQIEDFESGGFTTFPWVMGGNLAWTDVTSGAYQGNYVAKSGTITHSQTSQMSITAEVLSPGNITFYYKVSSESGYDYLRFYIDTETKGQWSGSAGWLQAVYPVSAGTHTFKWEYYKDGSQSVGSDCGWIDYIVFPPVKIAPKITTTTLPNWTAEFAYSKQMQASGGMGALTWSDKNGNLAGTGLSISTAGLVSGIPTTPGSISFTAKVTDAASSSDEKLFSFQINPVIEITTASLPDWTKGRTYSQQLAATGGTGALTWVDKNASLSGTGLSLSSAGLLSGVPSAPDTINLTAKATDQVAASHEHLFNFIINPAMVITTASLPDGIVGMQYSQQFAATGGTGTKIWRDKYNNLSGTGLAISSTGLLSGTPLATGQIGFYAEIEDVTGSKVNKGFTINIGAGFVCGDANGDGLVNVSDAVLIINYVFVPGAPIPNPLISGEVNCDGVVNVSDAVFIINYVFVTGSPLPCDCN